MFQVEIESVFLNNEEEMFGSLENKEQIMSQSVIIVKI
jgi:hypothetical protein